MKDKLDFASRDLSDQVSKLPQCIEMQERLSGSFGHELGKTLDEAMSVGRNTPREQKANIVRRAGSIADNYSRVSYNTPLRSDIIEMTKIIEVAAVESIQLIETGHALIEHIKDTQNLIKGINAFSITECMRGRTF